MRKFLFKTRPNEKNNGQRERVELSELERERERERETKRTKEEQEAQQRPLQTYIAQWIYHKRLRKKGRKKENKSGLDFRVTERKKERKKKGTRKRERKTERMAAITASYDVLSTINSSAATVQLEMFSLRQISGIATEVDTDSDIEEYSTMRTLRQ